MSAILDGAYESDLQVDDDGTRVYSVTYRVKTARGDGPLIARSAAGLPGYHSSYRYGNESDAAALRTRYCSTRMVSLEETRKLWDIGYKFSTKITECGKENIDNPMDIPPHWSGSFLKNRVPVQKDRFGQAIVNKADEPFVPAPEDDENYGSLVCEINLPTLDLGFWEGFYNHVNSDRVWGLEPRMVLFENFTWSRELYGKCKPYYPVRVEFLTNKKKWNIRLLNQGFMARAAIGENAKPIRIAPEGDRPDNPKLLDKNGLILAQNAPAIELEFQAKGQKKFRSLGLPREI